jgi:putative copper resistance protein D
VGALLGVLAAAVAVLVRGPVGYPELGLADPGLLVRVAVPVLGTVVDLAGAATVGGLIVALVVTTPPAGGEPFTPQGLRALGVARWAARVGAAGAALSVPATLADSTGGGLPRGPDLVTVMLARGEPVSWLVAAALGVATAVAAGEVRRWTGGAGVLVLAVAALLVPVATGHAMDGVGHDLALPALASHVVAAAVWTGTLGVLAVLRLRDPRATWRAARIGTAAGVATIASGAVAAAVALRGSPDGGTDYTALVLLTAALGVLAGAVLWRRRTGRATRPVELGVLAVVVGLSAVATRAVPPVQAPGATSTPTAVLGYGLAAAPDPEVLATSWRPDLTSRRRRGWGATARRCSASTSRATCWWRRPSPCSGRSARRSCWPAAPCARPRPAVRRARRSGSSTSWPRRPCAGRATRSSPSCWSSRRPCCST